MISTRALLHRLRPLHLCIGPTGHIVQAGRSFAKLRSAPLAGTRFFESFDVASFGGVRDIQGLHAMVGQTLRMRLRDVPEIGLRAVLIDDGDGGLIADLSFGIAVIDAVHRFGLTAQDFAPSDLAVELLFLHEAKSSAMAASFNLNTRLDGARLAAESRAMTDPLTGVHNRFALDMALSRLGQSQTDYAVLQIDLDLFKAVNDRLGHATGDVVLRQVASILRRHTRKDDMVVRTGGDEFLILCPGLTDQTRLSNLCHLAIAEISAPLQIEGHTVSLSASIGIGLSTHAVRRSPEHLCEMADIALYAAKRSGRGRYLFWSQEMGNRLEDLHIPQPVAP